MQKASRTNNGSMEEDASFLERWKVQMTFQMGKIVQRGSFSKELSTLTTELYFCLLLFVVTVLYIFLSHLFVHFCFNFQTPANVDNN